jgi:predicted DNA-binding protein (MmcQ/YjbR family)
MGEGGDRAMKSSNDPILIKIRSICLALPETKEVEAWGHPTFRAGKKMFAGCGSEAGNWQLGMKMSFDRQSQLLEDERFFPTPYAARQGWVSLSVNAKTDWAEVAALIEEAYRQVAMRRMLKILLHK